jgi:hypothetical protein
MKNSERRHSEMEHEESHLNKEFVLLIAGLGTFWTGVAFLIL